MAVADEILLIPRRRTELVVVAVRMFCALFSLVALADVHVVSRQQPVRLHLLVMVATMLVALLVLRARTLRAIHIWGRIQTGLDVALAVGWMAVFHRNPEFGTLYGFMAAFEGPLRYRWRGALATCVPVGLAALLFPQLQSDGTTQAPGTVLGLILLIAVGATGIATLIARYSATLRQAQDQFRLAFDDASTGMAVLDAHGRVLESNEAFAALVGRSGAELVGVPVPLLVASGSRTVAGDLPNRERLDLEFLNADGVVRLATVELSVLPGSAGVPTRQLLQARDVTAERAAARRLERRATSDELTGLLNRAGVLDELRDIVAATGLGDCCAAVFVDLDTFKVVNDTAGHAAGDAVLAEVGARLHRLVRPGDVVGRLGGDEFLVVLPDLGGVGEATRVAQRIRDGLRAPVIVDGRPWVCHASVGVAVGVHGDDPRRVLRAADGAMYLAKRAGGDTVRVAEDEVAVPSPRTSDLLDLAALDLRS